MSDPGVERAMANLADPARLGSGLDRAMRRLGVTPSRRNRGQKRNRQRSTGRTNAEQRRSEVVAARRKASKEAKRARRKNR